MHVLSIAKVQLPQGCLFYQKVINWRSATTLMVTLLSCYIHDIYAQEMFAKLQSDQSFWFLASRKMLRQRDAIFCITRSRALLRQSRVEGSGRE